MMKHLKQKNHKNYKKSALLCAASGFFDLFGRNPIGRILLLP
jgi:hypothetical protein